VKTRLVFAALLVAVPVYAQNCITTRVDGFAFTRCSDGTRATTSDLGDGFSSTRIVPPPSNPAAERQRQLHQELLDLAGHAGDDLDER
jgi:hypothetical protein